MSISMSRASCAYLEGFGYVDVDVFNFRGQNQGDFDGVERVHLNEVLFEVISADQPQGRHPDLVGLLPFQVFLEQRLADLVDQHALVLVGHFRNLPLSPLPLWTRPSPAASREVSTGRYKANNLTHFLGLQHRTRLESERAEHFLPVLEESSQLVQIEEEVADVRHDQAGLVIWGFTEIPTRVS